MRRELSPIQALATAARAFQKHWKALLAAAAAFYIPLNIAVELIPPALSSAVAQIYAGWANAAAGGGADALAVWADGFSSETLYRAGLYVLVEFALLALFAGMGGGAAAHVISCALKDEHCGVMETLNKTIGNAWKYALTEFTLYVVYALTAAAIVPVVFLAVAMCFTPFIINDTGKWGLAAYIESRRLTRGRWWRTFGFLLVVVGLEFLVTVYMPYTAFAAVNVFISAAWSCACFVFVMAVGVLYEDRKKPGGGETGDGR